MRVLSDDEQNGFRGLSGRVRRPETAQRVGAWKLHGRTTARAKEARRPMGPPSLDTMTFLAALAALADVVDDQSLLLA
jgi:hypothetical protein